MMHELVKGAVMAVAGHGLRGMADRLLLDLDRHIFPKFFLNRR